MGRAGLRFVVDFRFIMSLGAAWGFLTYVSYVWIFMRLPLPIGVLLAFTLFFPGLVGHVIVANTLLSRVIIGGVPSDIYVPTFFTETVGAVLSVLVGLAVAYVAYVLLRMYGGRIK